MGACASSPCVRCIRQVGPYVPRPKRVDICRPRSHLTPASAQLTQSWLAHRCLQYPFVARTNERVHVGSLDFRGGVRSESDETELKPFFGFDETTFRPSI